MLWNKPWGIPEGICICSGLVVTGLLLQLVIGPVVWQAFMWPANIIALGIFLLFLGIAYVLKERVPLFKFCLSYASAVPAICFVVVLTIIMGVTKQNGSPVEDDPLGLTYCLTNWSFVLIYAWIAWIVGLTAIHQLVRLMEGKHFNVTYGAALLSHLGLFLVLVCGTLGSADMQRLKMYCQYGQPEWRALDEMNKVHELPIAVQLDSFIIEEYPPKITLVDNKTMKAVEIGGKPLSVLVDNKFTGVDMGDWHITVDSVIDMAVPFMTEKETSYQYCPVKGAAPAVHVVAQSTKHKAPLGDDRRRSGRRAEESLEGWVSCGSYSLPSQMLTLDTINSIGMSQPEPRRYASKIQILSKEGDNVETIVEVNKPYSLMGWKIYQYSYNEQEGRWSSFSVFEFVTDPWLPVVYTGIGLLLLGAIGLFFGKKGGKQVSNSESSDSALSNGESSDSEPLNGESSKSEWS